MACSVFRTFSDGLAGCTGVVSAYGRHVHDNWNEAIFKISGERQVMREEHGDKVEERCGCIDEKFGELVWV